MRQAIEEGFILDVLKNYTTFKRYFKLAKKIEIVEDKEYEKKKAIRLLTSYVDLQPHAVEMKTRLVLDHFLEKTVNAIQGRGRATLCRVADGASGEGGRGVGNRGCSPRL